MPNVCFNKQTYEKAVLLSIIEHLPESTLFFRSFILNQLPNFYIEIPTQLTNKSSIKAADTITTVFVKVGSGNIKVFTNFILADTLFIQYFIYSQMQITIFHRKHSFTFLPLFYIMNDRNIIHRYIIHKSVRYLKDKHGEERD